MPMYMPYAKASLSKISSGAHPDELEPAFIGHATLQLRRSGRSEVSDDAAVASGIVAQGLQRRGPDRAKSSSTPAASGILGWPGNEHAAAARGVATPASSLPHLAAIQMSFGHHNVSGIQAHMSGEARASADAMGADAYATGNHVVFGRSTDLFTAAHEAAHVVQQRAGVQLKGGVGESGDTYERHADEVAALVVQGKSAESALDRLAGRGDGTATAGPSSVQRMEGSSSHGAADQHSEIAEAQPPARSHQPYLAPTEGEHLPQKEVSSRAYSRLQVAAQAIAATKAVIPHQGNQVPSMLATRLNSHRRTQVMRDDRCWEYANEETRQLARENPAALMAARAEIAHGGGCGENGWLAYHYLRLHAKGERLQLSRTRGLDHAFVIMGNLATERDCDLVISDPWPNTPTACLWEDHFAFTRDRTRIEKIDRMVADGKSYKDAILLGLRLSAAGQQRVQFEAADDDYIRFTVEQGSADGWVWNHDHTTASGRRFEYLERARQNDAAARTTGWKSWLACLPGRGPSGLAGAQGVGPR